MNHEEYTRLQQEVDSTLADIVQEFSDSREALHNDKRFVRTRLLLSFSFLEILCNVYNAYFNLSLGNRELEEKWLKEYCLNERNLTFKNHPYLSMVTEVHLYKFRNAIVHAFGLPEPENDISITSPNGVETADIIKKMDEGFQKEGHRVAFISADSLLTLFIDGFKLMHPEVFKASATATQGDFEGMQRVAIELGRRGAKGIPLDL